MKKKVSRFIQKIGNKLPKKRHIEWGFLYPQQKPFKRVPKGFTVQWSSGVTVYKTCFNWYGFKIEIMSYGWYFQFYKG